MARLFEFTANGIEFKDFQNLRQTIEDAWTNALGVNIDFSPTTPDGHHIDLECRVIRSVSECLQDVVANLNVSNASGEFLDFLGFFVGTYRNGDSDSDYRNRIMAAKNQGFATEEGMTSYLRSEIDSRVAVYSNDQDAIVDGIPPHAVRVIVPSDFTVTEDDIEYGIGEPQCDNFIAGKIFTCKGAGIHASGNKSGVHEDSTGREHVVYFSVPQSVSVNISVAVHRYGEESLPSDYSAQIKEAITKWSMTEFLPGKDVLPMRLIVPIMSVPGIESATILLKKSTDSSWSSNPIRIGSDEIATIGSIVVV